MLGELLNEHRWRLSGHAGDWDKYRNVDHPNDSIIVSLGGAWRHLRDEKEIADSEDPRWGQPSLSRHLAAIKISK